jgi:hypothetical protein
VSRTSAILPANRLGTAFSSQVFDPTQPANMARFIFLNPQAGDFLADWQGIANDAVAILCAPWTATTRYDRRLFDLVGALPTPARTSGCAGRPTTSSSAAPASRHCTILSSVTSPLLTSRSSFQRSGAAHSRLPRIQ